MFALAQGDAMTRAVGAAGITGGRQRATATTTTTTTSAPTIFEKTRLCKFFEKGRCRRGQACTFAHGGHELAPAPDFYRTQLCLDFFRVGDCPMGRSCNFAHSAEEVRLSQIPKKGVAQSRPADMEQARRQPQLPQPSPTAQQLSLLGLKAKLAELEAKVQQLTAAKSLCAEPEDDECDFTACEANGFSRQSTDEPPSVSLGGGLAYDDDLISWCGDFDQQDLAIAQHMLAEDEEVCCEMQVKNTFVSLVATVTSARTRAQSAPPRGR